MLYYNIQRMNVPKLIYETFQTPVPITDKGVVISQQQIKIHIFQHFKIL